MGNCAEGISLILGAGGDVNETDSQDWTPLHWAAYFGHKDVVDILLHNNADRCCTDSQGWTPRKLSVFVGESTIAQSLEIPISGPDDIVSQNADPLHGSCDACRRVGHVLVASYSERY
jgi:ankyrin repeat protein